VAVNYAGEAYGDTSFVEPWVDEHHEPETLGTAVGVLVRMVKRSVLDQVRTSFPYHRQVLAEDKPP
jgi:hypothetical protein